MLDQLTVFQTFLIKRQEQWLALLLFWDVPASNFGPKIKFLHLFPSALSGKY